MPELSSAWLYSEDEIYCSKCVDEICEKGFLDSGDFIDISHRNVQDECNCGAKLKQSEECGDL